MFDVGLKAKNAYPFGFYALLTNASGIRVKMDILNLQNSWRSSHSLVCKRFGIVK